MPEVKRIVCLANSRKLSGRCIAGKEFINNEPGDWIRPVSGNEHGEVSEDERRYDDGSYPKVLDIIEIPLIEPRPIDFQQENWLLDPQSYWVKVGQIIWKDLVKFCDPVQPLWIDDEHTFNGLNDTIPLSQVGTVQNSLRLLHVDSLNICVFKPGEAFGNSKRRVQGRFSYTGNDYHLWVTDPIYEQKFLSQPDGDYNLGESLLTISLGEPYNGSCYKLIAAIIERERG